MLHIYKPPTLNPYLFLWSNQVQMCYSLTSGSHSLQISSTCTCTQINLVCSNLATFLGLITRITFRLFLHKSASHMNAVN